MIGAYAMSTHPVSAHRQKPPRVIAGELYVAGKLDLRFKVQPKHIVALTVKGK